MAVSSPQIQDLEYLYASNANVSNFVSEKLSGRHNYHRWKTQMLCLMETHDMRGLVDDAFIDGPRALSEKTKKQYDSLLKGWIFGSLSEGVFDTVVDLGSAKDVWDTLKYEFGPARDVQPTMSSQQEEIKTESEDTILEDIEAGKDTISEDIEAGKGTVSEEAAVTMTEEETVVVSSRGRELYAATLVQNWRKIKRMLEKDKYALKEALKESGDTLLHIAVEKGYDGVVQKLLLFITDKKNEKHVESILKKYRNDEQYKQERREKVVKKRLDKDEQDVQEIVEKIKEGEKHVKEILLEKDVQEVLEKFERDKKDVKEILERKNADGNNALHIAVKVGNEHAMKLLIDKHQNLLIIKDKNDEEPLFKAFNNIHFETFEYLFDAAFGYDKSRDLFKSQGREKGASLVVNAITTKQYRTATQFIWMFPLFATENDEVLMAIARNFPTGSNYWETLIYPSTFGDTLEELFHSLLKLVGGLWENGLWEKSMDVKGGHGRRVPMFTFIWVRELIKFLVQMVLLALHLPYLLLWKVVERLVPRIKHIEKKIKVLEEAVQLLRFVCHRIDRRLSYNGPILEAAVQNAYEVFEEICRRSRETIESKDENGYDSFQLAVIYRSEKIYNILYTIGEDKNRYRTIEDSSENNMLHLAARLAPSHVLKRRTGAALQLQRELQWFEELKEFMHPSSITKQNIYGETPPEVFTREHENLVKEGEKWLKTTAESCSISAALITTIVFAAAITVPGGSNQETGIPMFRKDIAFSIFAISDAISLFTSTSSLMVFLSILTARFAENDFLVSLPKQLIIGLCTLLLSITAMMVAFGATLYLLFTRERQWMIGPICGFSCLPILLFVTLQFPLIADLYRSTYVPIFPKRHAQLT